MITTTYKCDACKRTFDESIAGTVVIKKKKLDICNDCIKRLKGLLDDKIAILRLNPYFDSPENK